MALTLSHAPTTSDIIARKRRADRLLKMMIKRRQKKEDVLAAATQTAGISATAFALGLVAGKRGPLTIPFTGDRVPAEPVIGLAAHTAAFMGWAGDKHAAFLHAVGDGALGSWVNQMGRKIGRSLQTPADVERMRAHGGGALADGRFTMGADDLTGGASLADHELARMVAASK